MSLTYSLTLSKFFTTHSLVSHYYYAHSVLRQYASMTTRRLSPSNHATNSLHILIAIIAPRCRPLPVHPDLETLVSTHLSAEILLELLKPYRDNLFKGLLESISLRLNHRFFTRGK